MDIKQEIIKEISKQTGLKEINLEIPPEGLGDYSFPCFSLSKTYKKNPAEIAQELARKIQLSRFIEKIEIKGPYINFFINKAIIAEDVLKNITKKKKAKAQKILVEHTSINPNASPHIGRARNALIGDFIVRLLKFNGHKVETHYFVNDVGKQIAMLVLGSKGKKSVKFSDLLKLYIKINKDIEKKPELEKEVFDLLRKLEQGDKKVKKQFKDIVNVCIKGQTKILSDLGLKYDKFDYESDYLWTKKTDEILNKLKKTGKLFEDEKKRYVLDQKDFNLAMKSPVLVLTRADKTSLYPLRDIAYHIDKKKNKSIIVLGEDQKLYYEQTKAALTLLKHPAPQPVFYSFVLLATGKMSTRKGNLVLLEDFMKEALQKAKAEIKKRHQKVNEENAKKIAYGAIKYSILKVSPEKNVTFSWKALNFEGDTGPYLQYAYARINSILKKYGKKINTKVDFSLLNTEEETKLIKRLSDFTAVIDEAEKNLRPNIVANYLYNLAQDFSNFYVKCPILKAEEKLKKARLLLADSVKHVLENGLNLLGIGSMGKM